MSAFVDIYIYNLPYAECKKLCHHLDQNNRWEELACKHMQYDNETIKSINKIVKESHKSPTYILLEYWGLSNHTITELFELLRRMKLYQAMIDIKHLIDNKYHHLIRYKNNDKRINDDNSVCPVNRNLDSIKVLKAPFDRLSVSKESNETNKQPARLGDVNSLFSSPTCNTVSVSSITYEELGQATHNWDKNNILGNGGFGVVYRGYWKHTEVAIKRIQVKNQRSSDKEREMMELKQSITELDCLNSYRHDNILPLYGYTTTGMYPCLIYQFMAGGSLDRRLLTRDLGKVLSWPQRLKIAISTARGLQFLHTHKINGKPLVHGDIKTPNILLDSNDQPKIGDFGLARQGPNSETSPVEVSRKYGTIYYLPTEFIKCGTFTTKLDTYSFGIVLFEIYTSLSVYSTKRKDTLLKNLVLKTENVTELKAPADYYEACFDDIISVGKMCVLENYKQRPTMVQVLSLLEEINGKI